LQIINVSKEFAEELMKRGIIFIAIKRKNMIKNEEEKNTMENFQG